MKNNLPLLQKDLDFALLSSAFLHSLLGILDVVLEYWFCSSTNEKNIISFWASKLEKLFKREHPYIKSVHLTQPSTLRQHKYKWTSAKIIIFLTLPTQSHCWRNMRMLPSKDFIVNTSFLSLFEMDQKIDLSTTSNDCNFS